MQSDPIIIEQTYPVIMDRVWDAITDPAQMRQWFFDAIPSFEPRVGFHTAFDVQAGNRVYRHLWTVTEVVPQKRLSYDWRYEGYTGESSVTWELSRKGNITLLRLTHAGTETFDRNNPDFSRDSGIAGWNFFLCERLKGLLESR